MVAFSGANGFAGCLSVCRREVAQCAFILASVSADTSGALKRAGTVVKAVEEEAAVDVGFIEHAGIHDASDADRHPPASASRYAGCLDALPLHLCGAGSELVHRPLRFETDRQNHIIFSS